MGEFRIVPWDHQLVGIRDPEFYVPPEIVALSKNVLARYNMKVSKMTCITTKPDKGGAIWKLETDKGPRSLKILHRIPSRSLFSIGAQDYMVKNGARVSPIIPTKDNKLYVESGGKLWIVNKWIEPLVPVSKVDLAGASALCYGLGEFHKFSKGYVPSKGVPKSSRIHGWEKYYDKILTKINWFKNIALAYNEFPASKNLLGVVDEFDRQARDILGRFKKSAYTKMVAKGEPHWGLVHQDYGWSNGQMGPKGIWVIDLDGVAYDFPIRDLRKIITSTMSDLGAWDITWVRGMIEAYHKANPMDRETFELLWIDMAFPNEFYKEAKEMIFDPKTYLNTEADLMLKRVLAPEPSKWKVLNELKNDKSKYPPGDYKSTAKPTESTKNSSKDSSKQSSAKKKTDSKKAKAK